MLQLLKPANLESVLRNERSHCNESLYTTKKSAPCLLQLEKAHAKPRRLSAAKNEENSPYMHCLIEQPLDICGYQDVRH